MNQTYKVCPEAYPSFSLTTTLFPISQMDNKSPEAKRFVKNNRIAKFMRPLHDGMSGFVENFVADSRPEADSTIFTPQEQKLLCRMFPGIDIVGYSPNACDCEPVPFSSEITEYFINDDGKAIVAIHPAAPEEKVFFAMLSWAQLHSSVSFVVSPDGSWYNGFGPQRCLVLIARPEVLGTILL